MGDIATSEGRPRWGAHLKIDCPTGQPRSARVWLEGVEISRFLRGVQVHLMTGGVVEASLELSVDGLEMDARTLGALTAYVNKDRSPHARPGHVREELDPESVGPWEDR